MKVRVDRWLWAVRVYKTRTQASAACSNGRVSVNERTAKPSTLVTVGDTVTARRRDRTLVYEVAEPLTKRVSPGRARECVIDHSPPVDRPVAEPQPRFAVREPGSGRPTKRERRQLDRLRRRR